MASHSNVIAWRIPYTEEPVGLYNGVAKESDATERLSLLFFFHCVINLIMQLSAGRKTYYLTSINEYYIKVGV